MRVIFCILVTYFMLGCSIGYLYHGSIPEATYFLLAALFFKDA
jgi:hypothetical protein